MQFAAFNFPCRDSRILWSNNVELWYYNVCLIPPGRFRYCDFNGILERLFFFFLFWFILSYWCSILLQIVFNNYYCDSRYVVKSVIISVSNEYFYNTLKYLFYILYIYISRLYILKLNIYMFFNIYTISNIILYHTSLIIIDITWYHVVLYTKSKEYNI